MKHDQLIIIAILAATMGMFLWGRWRHDLVALGALLLCVMTQLVSANSAFFGFGNPAVITVACVLILSFGLQITGAVDLLARYVLPKNAGPSMSIFAITGLAALLSGFMNNVGALALLMPLAMQIANKHNLPSGKILMPLSFSAILGGTITLIGTPPNLIISEFRNKAGLGYFGMFDFAGVGLSITVVGVIFIAFIGWRLVPSRRQNEIDSFETGNYFSEVRIVKSSKAINRSIRDVEKILEDADAQIIGMVRHDLRLSPPNPGNVLREDDILIIEAEPESLSLALSRLDLQLAEDVPVQPKDENVIAEQKQIDEEIAKTRSKEIPKIKQRTGSSSPELRATRERSGRSTQEIKVDKERTESVETIIRELVVMPDSVLIGRSAIDIRLRTRYGINLLAISHQGRRSIKRLRSTKLQAGDVLLVQGTMPTLSGFASEFGCLPLAERDIRVPKKGQAVTAISIMIGAVLMTSTGFQAPAVSFALGALLFVVLGIVPLRSIYTSIEWPVIVLLGAMLPVASAMDSTGAASVIANFLVYNVAQGHKIYALIVILVITILLTDFMNNAATAALMCPIALGTANQLGVNSNPFLMAVAIGASCAFLTPIGHQNNTLILGPGGFRFGDYWRMGLPLDLLIVAVSIPMLLLIWPM
jgi:di/tricarboxylate transporter